MKMKSATTNQ